MPSEPRAAVAALLRAAQGPLSASEVADSLGTHVTTARFHLRKLIDEGKAVSVTLRSDSVGRPRTGYTATTEIEVDALLSALIGQLGPDEQARESAAARAGQQWAAALAIPAHAELPDPVTVVVDALGRLGFVVSDVMSAFGVHEITLCSCPLRLIGASHPEVARGIARGAIENALASSSPVLAAQYGVSVSPASDGDCGITLRLSRRHTTDDGLRVDGVSPAT